MIHLLFQMSSLSVLVPDSADLQFTLPKSGLYYTVPALDFDFTLPVNKLTFTVDE